ncbi:hypothetical protein AB0F88_38615 [Streptosporangium sp. NPDC023963]|uniref:hypothetical protein n=1 Tax=Streptosporangium sp. NPDC023963 TaxID=3155608 RepID=UPI0034145913
MELLLFMVVVGSVLWFLGAAIESGHKIDPAKLAADLKVALGRGDSIKARRLLKTLPEWKAVDSLKRVAGNTCDLRRDMDAAVQAGVSQGLLGPLPHVIGRNDEIVITIARKVAALALQSERKLKKLPPAARDLLDADVRRLEYINQASQTVRNSLLIATASIQGDDAVGRADALEAFGRALHELGNG